MNGAALRFVIAGAYRPSLRFDLYGFVEVQLV